ncbi:MAG TPA: NAD-dependent epimerase/dehydratase family protein [Anaerolineales bacterium]|nr:NAD-dependent epimerase/dehydratase family protein [Anaerolineales bacterium]
MTTFVTGGTSSIGRVLIKQLARQNKRVRVLARRSSNRRGLELPGVEFVYGDVTDPEAVRLGMQGCDRVTHMAAIVGYNVPEVEWWRVNKDGTCNVLESARELGIRSIVQVSSISVLGPTQPGEMADENRPVDTSKYFNLYQKTKRAADDLCRAFAAPGLQVKIVYPGFGYGCSFASSHPSLQEQTLLRMATGKPVAIMGTGKNRLCLSYYNDTVEGIDLAHQYGRAGEDYILIGENLTFVEIWEHIASLLGKQPPTRKIPLPLLQVISKVSQFVTGKSLFPPEFFEMISMNWCFSSEKAKRELGWTPHSFADGIALTWKKYQRATNERERDG